MDLHRFRSGLLRAILAIKCRTMRPTDLAAIHSDEFKRDAGRIALTSGLTRRQAASDLGVWLSSERRGTLSNPPKKNAAREAANPVTSQDNHGVSAFIRLPIGQRRPRDAAGRRIR